MNRVFIAGDYHGELDIHKISSKKFPEGKNLTKEDFVICLGDFGLIWKNTPDRNEKYWLNWLEEKPYTTLFLDGNHENFDRLELLPEVKKFGDVVGKVNDSIFHLRRGRVYTIGKSTFFTFGGAQSVDKSIRVERISWWKQELPTYREQMTGIENLKQHNWLVDFILTHDAPRVIINEILQKQFGTNFTKIDWEENTLTKYLDFLFFEYPLKFKHHYFGHHHLDETIETLEHTKHTVCFDKIHEAGEGNYLGEEKWKI